MDKPIRRPMGLGQGPLGLRAAAGRPDASGSRGNPPPRPGSAAAFSAGRRHGRTRLRDARARGPRALGMLRLLHGGRRGDRRRAALRARGTRGTAGLELSPALSDRNRADAAGPAREQDRHRHARGGDRPPGRRDHHAGRTRGEPDAHRRRERRRRPVQHPESAGHGEGGGRKRDARGDRPLRNPADPDRRAADDRGRCPRAHAEDARSLQCRHPGDRGAAAEGRPAGAGHRGLPRRAGRACRPRALRERSAGLRQSRGAGGARQGGADHPGGGSLSPAGRRRSHRRDRPLPEDLRAVPEGARGHARTDVSRDNGARARRRRQDHRRFQGERSGALPAAQRARPSGGQGAGAPKYPRAAYGGRPMRLKFLSGLIIVLVAAALIVAYSSVFTVYQTQQALVFRLGSPQPQVTEHGLHLKAPFIDTVVYIDKRILDLDVPAQEVIASDQKRLVVDAFARYRVKDPLRFYQTLGSIDAANSQLAIRLNSALRRVLGEVTFTHVVRDQRAELMTRIRQLVDREAQDYGIEVVDVRIRRADLPEQNSQAVYRRMQTERQREAAEFRAQGTQRAQEIRSQADREVTVLIAEANSKAEQIRGEGDATRNQIFAQAYSQDPEFFDFYRSMQAYETGLKASDTRLLLRPDSNFFRYFNDPTGQRPAAAPAR